MGAIALTVAATAALGAGLVLEANAYLAFVALAVFGLVAVIGLLVQLENPFLGLAVLVAMAVAFPLEFRGPAGVMMSTPLPLTALVCAVWLLRILVVSRDAIDSSRVVYAALALMGVTLLSFGMGQFPWFASGGAPLPAQIVEVGLFVLSALLFLAVGHQVESLAQLKWLTWILIGAGAIAATVQSFPDQLALVGRMTTRPGSVGSLFWTWLLALSFSQALFNRQLSPFARACLLGVTGLVLFHGLVQVRSWASGWLPPLAAMGVIMLMRFPRLTIGVGMVAVPVALLFGGDLVASLMGEESYSLSTRQGAWATLWGLVERSPILGTGPANYYYLTENISIMGWYVRFISHNNYQDLLVQTGIVGLLVFVWFALEAMGMILRLRHRLAPGFPTAYLIGALGGLAGSMLSGMLGDWIIPFYYNAGILGFRSSLLFWLFLGGVLAMKRMAERAMEQEQASAREVEAAPPARYGRISQADWA